VRRTGREEKEKLSQWSSMSEGCIYAPPWASGRKADGSPILPYGPTSESEMARLTAEYRSTRAGGGLWDDEIEAAQVGHVSRKARAMIERADQEHVDHYLDRHSGSVPERELICAVMFWGRGACRRTLSQIAREMGVKAPTVREWVRRMRERVTNYRRAYDKGAQVCEYTSKHDDRT
jgi:hypothetical protein